MRIVRNRWTGLLALLILAGCARQPPSEIQEAVAVMDRHLGEYVRESNQALEAAEHPDAERLTGVGERLLECMDALKDWTEQEATR